MKVYTSASPAAPPALPDSELRVAEETSECVLISAASEAGGAATTSCLLTTSMLAVCGTPLA